MIEREKVWRQVEQFKDRVSGEFYSDLHFYTGYSRCDYLILSGLVFEPGWDLRNLDLTNTDLTDTNFNDNCVDGTDFTGAWYSEYVSRNPNVEKTLCLVPRGLCSDISSKLLVVRRWMCE